MEIDFQKIGLRCGLEIHQQLNTKKLFCSCPSQLNENKPDFIVERELKAVAGEHGEIDLAALHEELKGKRFVYYSHYQNTCLVELDEEPPHQINQESLKTAFQVSLMLKARIPQYLEIMRKTVIDGSNTSGFQRTVLVGQDGFLKTSFGKVRISNICLEEDSARIVKEEGNKIVYNLDRLGIPLIEIGTEPEIFHPSQAKETAALIGMFLRSTGKAKRGIGTIRQDINISIKEGARVEIKGCQELDLIPKIIELECLRQLNLLEIKKELERKRIGIESLFGEMHDLKNVFLATKSKLIEEALKKKDSLFGFKISQFKDFLKREIVPGKRLGKELSEIIKIRTHLKGLIHSDELPNYGISEKEVNEIKKALNCREDDAFIFLFGQEETVKKAGEIIKGRIAQLLKGIPAEVRKANPDASSSYLRPMPGPARMYPETDHSLIKVEIKDIKLPELIDDKIRRFVKTFCLSEELAREIAYSERLELFEKLVRKNKNIKPAFLAETLTGTLRNLKRDYQIDIEKIKDKDLEKIFDYFSSGRIHKDNLVQAMIDLAKGEFDEKKYQKIEERDLIDLLKRIVKENPQASFSVLIGLAMKELNYQVAGRIVAEKLKEILVQFNRSGAS